MESPGLMQSQLRRNNEELVDYLKGLENWEEEMKEKDQQLSKHKSILKENFPPVRSSVAGLRKKAKRKKKESAKVPPASRIHSYDYRAWDQFDVEKACEEVDYEVETSSESDGDEKDKEGEEVRDGGLGESVGASSSEEEEMERHRIMAAAEKEKGNVLYKEGNYEEAVECYSRGILLDPVSAALPANRAMALLKLERYAAVEDDCDTAITLDEHYVKAYLRRGVARRHLGKLPEAIKDFEMVLQLEPKNKQAHSELKTTKELREEEERKRLIAEGHVFPVKRPPHMRSKKPLKKIMISETTPYDDSLRPRPSSSLSSKVANPVREISRGITDNGNQEGNLTPLPSDGSTMEDGCNNDNMVEVAPMAIDDTTSSADKEIEETPVPLVPETSFQFQADWKTLRHNQSLLTTYFKQIPPSKYPVLLQQSLETSIFSDIIAIIGNNLNSNWLEELDWLTRVQRFSVAIMFLSTTDKRYLEKIFEESVSACRTNNDRDLVKTLSSKFGVKLKL